MKTNLLKAVVANQKGEIFEIDAYAAVGMSAAVFTPLDTANTLPLPHGSEFMFLPQRSPVLFNIARGRIEPVAENPYAPGEPIFPVAAFNSPGYMVSALCAYKEMMNAKTLPLFSYGAVGFLRGKFRSTAIRVDREKRQDLRFMQHQDIIAGISRLRKEMPRNRLRKHLENCALQYGCPAAKNFFLARYEAPLPTAKRCNARCLGCLSLQPSDAIPVSQDRITFTPSPAEIAQVALAHIKRVPRGIVSFGQGCEGDPLLAAHVIEPAIRIIRAQTRRGTINMNTNGSRPDILGQLFEAGLDSVRISLNSVRESCYNAYFRPRGYGFANVLGSIDLASRRKKFVSINYLNCPGFTDTPQESEALLLFLEQHRIHMIQWRNLNIDPMQYLRAMNSAARHGPPLGTSQLLAMIRNRFPDLKFGYFNPAKEKFNLQNN